MYIRNIAVHVKLKLVSVSNDEVSYILHLHQFHRQLGQYVKYIYIFFN